MSYIRHEHVTLTLSTLGAAVGYSSRVFNGFVHSIYLKISKAVGNNSKITVANESTDNVILLVANPSTLGDTYYPRNAVVNSTGSVIGSTAIRAENILHDERFRISVTSSSGLNAQTVEAEVHVF